jgi:hypothetical protein
VHALPEWLVYIAVGVVLGGLAMAWLVKRQGDEDFHRLKRIEADIAESAAILRQARDDAERRRRID